MAVQTGGGAPGLVVPPQAAAGSGQPAQQSGGQPSSALSRFEYQAGQEQSNAQTQLALLQPAAVTGTTQAGVPGSGTWSDHPSAQRMNTRAWEGFTGQLNNAQAAQQDADVWVTVPVDKVTVSAGRGHAVAPVYASTKGYRPRPGESAGSIPPAQAVGR